MTEENQPLFRKAPLELLTSPEQLDRLLVVVSPKAWLALFCLVGVLIAVLIWSLTGSIPVVANGKGLVFNPKSIFQSLPAIQSGTVQEIHVKFGDLVKKGDPLVTLRNSLLELEVGEAQRRLNSIQGEFEELKKEIAEQNCKRKASIQEQLAVEKSILKLQKEKIEELKGHLQSLSPSIAEEEQLLDFKIQLEKQEALILSLQTDLILDEGTSRLDAKKIEVSQATDYLQQLVLKQQQLVVKAPDDSLVVNVIAHEGTYANTGDALLWLQTPAHPSSQDEIFGFVPLSQGESLKVGMPVEIEVEGINPETYGRLVARVKEVLPYTSSPYIERLRALPSPKLTAYLQGIPIAVPVIIEPLFEEHISSKYKWTKVHDPNPELIPGTFCSFKITTQNKRPISYILPFLQTAPGQ